VRDDEQRAEAAHVLSQPRELRRDRVGAADDPDVVAEVLERDLRIRHGGIDLEHVEAAELREQFQEIVAVVAPERAPDRLASRLGVGVGDEDVARDAPRLPIGDAAGALRPRLHGLPVRLQNARRHEVDGHRDVAALAREHERLRVRGHAGHADRRVRLLVGPQMQAQADVRLRLRHGEAPAPALALVGSGLGVLPERQHGVEDLAGDHAMLAALGIDAEHLEVTGEAAGADAPVEASARHLVQLRDALGQHERVVVGQARDAGGERHPLRHAERPRDEEIGARDVLPLRREVLADPRLFVTEPVQRRQLDEVVVHRPRRVGPRRMQRHRKIAESHRDPPP